MLLERDRLDELLTSPRFFDDPYSVYRRLQEEDPVHWCAPWRQWVVTRHGDVEEVLKSPDRFSSAGWEARYLSQLPEEVRAELPRLERHYATAVLSNTDAPAHRRLRTMVIKSFTPRVLRSMTPSIEALVDRMLGELDGLRETDLIASFAYPMPAVVIAQLLGAPEEHRDRYASWSADVVAFVGTGRPEAERARRLEASLREFSEHLEPLVRERRLHPVDDLLSHLAGEHDGERLTDAELVATCVTLLFAGHETTANLLANGLVALLRHPDQLALLRERPELIPGAVEELLRFDGPVQRVRRVAREDTELGGRRIAKGDLVMAFLGAANRDPEVFSDPDALDVSRDLSHVAFGHGVHFCVGAGLSRIEAPIALREILRRFPDLRLATDDLRWKPNLTFRGLEALPVRLQG
jgi:cytochrome P450